MKINDIINEGKEGLWDKIRAKQERIKNGSGERMRKPGSKGAPTAQNFKDAASEGVAEAVWDRPSQSYVPRDGRTFGQTNHPREEHCDACGAATGHAGPGEDSNVDDEGNVYCDDCYADQKGVAEGSTGNDDITRLKSGEKTSDGIGMQDIRLMASEGKLSDKTILQALAVIRKQRSERSVAEGQGHPSDNDMGTTTGGTKMTLAQWKQMWMKKMPSADFATLFRSPPSMPGSAIAYFDGWMNNPDARWDPVKRVAEGSEDSKYPHGEVKYRIVYRKSGERVEGIRPFNSKADAQQYAAKDPQYSVQAYRVKESVAEGSNGEYDDESGMAETNLHTIARAAQGLLDTIDDNENLPEWVQEKIAKVEGMMTSAWDYLESQEEQGVDPRQGVAEDQLDEISAKLAQSVADKRIGKAANYRAGLAASGVDQDAISKYPPYKKMSDTAQKSQWAATQRANKEQDMSEGAPIVVAQAPIDIRNPKKAPPPYRNQGDIVPPTKPPSTEKRGVKGRPGQRPMPKYDESILEETYHDDDEFFEAYGVMEYNDEMINEAEYQGRKVTLNKPMRGDSKKFKVFVKNEKGNVVKVNFGQKGARIKKNNPGRRKNFRARHNCDNPGPKTGARYWSCRKW